MQFNWAKQLNAPCGWSIAFLGKYFKGSWCGVAARKRGERMHCEQLSFWGQINPENARYKAVAAMRPAVGGALEYTQKMVLPPSVPVAVAEFLPERHDVYATPCDYYQPRRAGDTIFGFTAFAFDVDCHGSQDPAEDALRTYTALTHGLFNTPAFPMPTMVEHTGRGLLVLVAFERCPRSVLPLWLRMGELFAERIRAVLPSFALLDPTYQDAARVVRVPGSFNSAAGRHSYALIERAQDVPYTLSGLRDAYCPELKPKSGSKRPSGQRGKVVYTDKAIMLHVDRLQDIRTLVELRGFAVTGLRETILFLYRYWSCFFIGPESALEAALDLNRHFTKPLSVTEVTRATRSAETAFNRWMNEKKAGYNYRNDTLIRLLSITDEEQRQLKTIITKEEKARRRAEKKQWVNGKRDRARAAKREGKDDEIARYLQMGMSIREIKRLTRTGQRKIEAVRVGITKN